MTMQQPEALRLAHLLELDKWPDAAEELRRLHARVQELESIERQLCEQADVAANAYRELQSEAANNARIIGASAEKELALRARVEELGRELAAIGAGGVEPLRKRAEAAPQAEQAAVPEAIEQMAAVRYKVVPSHESMFHRWAVVADTGAQQLYIGREGECQNMARKFMGAFLDGAFVAMQNAAPPHPKEGFPSSPEDALDAERWMGIVKVIFGDEDHVLVPRGLIGAACYAIDKKRDGTKTLAELRRYTTGDLSAATKPADLALRVLKQPEATPIAWYVTGCSTLLDEHEAKSEAKRCGGSAKAVPLYTHPPTVNQQLTDQFSDATEMMAAPQAVPAPPFTAIAQRKLDDLLAQGFRVTGYAIERTDVADWAPQRGFVTHGGFVGWWRPMMSEEGYLSKDQIRSILLANGYTIKPGHDDLKPYVYAAARALLDAAPNRPRN